MTDTQLTHDQLVIAHRNWVGPVLRLEPQAAHEFLSACDDSELAAIAALQGATKREKLATLKPIYSDIAERTMTRQPAAPAADPADFEEPAGV